MPNTNFPVKIINTNASENYNYKKLEKEVLRQSGTNKIFVSFSTGADSIAMFLHIIENGYNIDDIVMYYYYYVPGLSWITEYLDYFQDKYKVKIIQVPSAIFLNDMASWLYTSPFRAEAVNKFIGTDKEIRYMTKDEINHAVKIWSGLPESCYTAIGIKCGDSPIRRKTLRENRGISKNKKKWYPIWNYENGDVIRIIKRHNVKVPYDYELFGISFENIDYRFSKIVKEKMPEDWEKIKDYFPMIESVITRNEYYHPEWKTKRGVMKNSYGTLVLKPGEHK